MVLSADAEVQSAGHPVGAVLRCCRRQSGETKNCHASLLGEDARMTSSSKRRASSSKQSSAGKAQVISVGRKDALPRTGNVSPGRRKPAVPSPVDAPKEPLAKALARSNKKAPKL